MAQQNINLGSSANDGTGDPLRTAFNKTQQNFTELYAKGLQGTWTFPASAFPTATAALQEWIVDGNIDVGDEFFADGTLLISKAAGTGTANFWKKQG